MSDSFKSKVPYYTFPTDSVEAQLESLSSNPLMQRMLKYRSTYNDAHRPRYHYVNPEGTLNDPNGLCFWYGNWHLFYQAYPPEDPRQHWGHAYSSDLIHWQDLPYCIYPDPEECCFSGSTLVEDDRVIAMYHGTKVGNMVATSSDPLLLNWQKIVNRAVIPFPDSDDAPYKVFDPCIWRDGDYYYSLSAGTRQIAPRNQFVAADYLFRSKDLVDWEYLHPFYDDNRFTRLNDDGACPYFWPIGDRHILLFFSHNSGGQYLLGDYDKETQKFMVTNGGKFNFGAAAPCGVHAPSACPTDDGDVLVIFNMNSGKKATGWDQIMSLPRRLSLNETSDDIVMQPAGDYQSLRTDETRYDNFKLANNEIRALETSRSTSCELNLSIARSNASVVELRVLESASTNEYTRVSIYENRGYFDRSNFRTGRSTAVTLDTSNSSLDPNVHTRPPETVYVPIEPDQTIDLQVFVDQSIVEIFVNEQKCVAARVYPVASDSKGISIRSLGGTTEVEHLVHWQMSSIY